MKDSLKKQIIELANAKGVELEEVRISYKFKKDDLECELTIPDWTVLGANSFKEKDADGMVVAEIKAFIDGMVEADEIK